MSEPTERILHTVTNGTLRVCYLFAGAGIGSTVVTVTFDPPDGSCSVTLSLADPCSDVVVPDTAEGCTLHDVDGTSPDVSFPL